MLKNSVHTAVAGLCIVLYFAAFSLPTRAEIIILPPNTPEGQKVSRPNLSGNWIRNQGRSDDAGEKMKAALQAARSNRRAKRQTGMSEGHGNGGGKGKGQGGGNKARADAGGVGRSGRRLEFQDVQKLLMVSEHLIIDHQDPVFLVVGDDGTSQRVFTDYRGMAISASSAIQQKLSTASWQGNDLVVETTDNDGLQLIQHYKLDPASAELIVDSQLRLPSQADAVRFTTVYSAELARVGPKGARSNRN